MRTIETTIYRFDELSESAKEKARDWWRAGSCGDNFWSEYVIEDAKECAAILGITIENIYWSGFCSQGDGASFTGDYRYKKDAVKSIASHTGNDETLVTIAKRLQELQRINFYQLRATITQSGHYVHSNTMRAELWRYDDKPVSEDAEDDLLDCMRDFANWIYRNLENEWNYQNSNECVDETIRANEYEFTEEGEIV